MKTAPAGVLSLFFVGLLAAPIVADDYIHERGGCPNAFRKFAESQKTAAYTKITFFGGSITEGAGASKPENCYRELTMRQLQQDYPGAVLAENNSAIGGTGSWLGAFRTSGDAMYGGAALVFVEFAVNDGGDPEQQVYASMEGIVRQIFARDSSTDVVFLYTLVKNHMDAYKQGKLPDRVAWHEKIAAHYGIPSVNLGQYAAEKILKGELTFDEFAKDGVHPTDRGYALYMDALRPFLARCKAAAASGGPARHALPKAVQPRADGACPVRALSTGKARRRLEDRPAESRRPLHARPARRSARRYAHLAVPGQPGGIFRRHRSRFVRLRGFARRRAVETAARFRFLLPASTRGPTTGRSPPGWIRRSGTNCGCGSPRSSRPRARAAWRGSAGCWSTAGSRIRLRGLRRWPGSTRFTPPWTPWTTRRPPTAGGTSTAPCSGSARAAR